MEEGENSEVGGESVMTEWRTRRRGKGKQKGTRFQVTRRARRQKGTKYRESNYGFVQPIQYPSRTIWFGFVQGPTRPLRATQGHTTREEAERELLSKYPNLKPSVGRKWIIREYECEND
jgi:hypothetical protein